MSGAVTEPLVSVIIPAYNAAVWIEQTLASVMAQTHRALEIIVVDDGSSDATADIVRRYAAQDSRILIVQQANAGVAAARNHGARVARSDLLAFIDADDLWAPEKTERQLAALTAAGPAAGLCYSWYAMIDGENRILWKDDAPPVSGQVLEQLFHTNFIGNGSAPLVRRAAFDDAGGFEPALRNAGAQGCEDLLFYCRVAEHHEFAVVPDYHIGYRQTADNMSSDLARMLRSWLIVIDEMTERHPDKRAILDQGLYRCARLLTRRAVHRHSIGMLTSVLATVARRNVGLALRMGLIIAPGAVIERLAERLRLKRPAYMAHYRADDRYAIGRRYDEPA